jgi:signal transduction histidine kinase/DNA-binding LacI/PurR family transcriptional regulator
MEDNRQTAKPANTGLRNGRPTIGFLTHGIWDTFGVRLWHGVMDATQEEDVNLICFPGGDLNATRYVFEAQANMVYDLASAENVDGLVVSGSALSSFVGVEGLRTFCGRYRPLPMVNLSVALEGIPAVLVDNDRGMREVMIHLIDVHGCRRVAFIPGPADNAEAQERYRAYTDVLKKRDVPFDPDLVTPPGDWNPPSGYDGVQFLLDQRKVRFDAVVAANDGMAIGALEALQARGIVVPDDIIVTGFNDSDEVRFATPPFTTIRQPIHDQVKQATKMVLAQLRGDQVPEQVILPTKLVVRQSCGCLDPKVVQAAAGLRPAAQPERPRTAAGDTFKAALAAEREKILVEMSRAVEDRSGHLPTGWAAHLLDALVAELDSKSAGGFLLALDKVLRHVIAAESNVADWHGVLSVLRRHALPYLGNHEVFQAEDLWQQARVMIGETEKRVEMYQAWQKTRQARLLGEIEEDLITTFDVARLADLLVEKLPHLGIPSCYLSLYENAAAPAEWAWLILAYNEQGRVALEAKGQHFPSQHLVPEGLLPPERRYNLVVEPLYFQEYQLGFVVFEVGPRDGDIYEVLRRELCSALQGALLVQRVRERSAELEAANKELEAFSYSVSHDLRAPLRAIDGFSCILMEDYAPQLPSEVGRYLKTIRESSQQMGHLIDDLLAFSRLSRQPLNKQPVAMDNLVRQALADLHAEQEGRHVEIVMGDLPPCQADPGLLRQVWINLLSNALKFTRGRDDARIEVGCTEQDGEQVYFVKDNGAGFDMQYVGKLFGVFQRLHRSEEYKGTGVGLAIVQRIVHRHGGRVWAEAAPSVGATFYFTLG